MMVVQISSVLPLSLLDEVIFSECWRAAVFIEFQLALLYTGMGRLWSFFLCVGQMLNVELQFHQNNITIR